MSLRRLILIKTGSDLRHCMGCESCSDVVSPDQDISLYSLIQLVLLNDEEVLTSRTVWSDDILTQARKACRREFDIEQVILCLRDEAIQRGLVER